VPHYLNLVAMGFEWNKYNQAHYDEDNPPPKTVWGYKFNIFYPQAKASPKFVLVNEEDGNLDTVIIKFTTGAPYKDLSFRILNREWETIERHGFKSRVDEHGLLQLHF
jgi:hypothetical protein